MWSSLAAPMQHAAAYVLGEPDEVRDHVARSRRLHRLVSDRRPRAGHRRGRRSVARRRAPSTSIPTSSRCAPRWRGAASSTGAQLAALLLEGHDVAVLEGEAFGDDPAALRFRMATSLLYGADEAQRWEALRADDPVALPWIAGALERLGETLRALRELGLRPPRRATPRTSGRRGWLRARGAGRPTRRARCAGSAGSLASSMRAESPRRAASSVAISTRRSSRGPAISRIGAPADAAPFGGGGQVGERLGDGPGGDQLGAHLRHVGHVARAPHSMSCATNSWNCAARSTRAGIGPDEHGLLVGDLRRAVAAGEAVDCR